MLPGPSPLLEEERHLQATALIANREHPLLSHRPGSRPALTPDDDPIDSCQIDLAKVFEQVFKDLGGEVRDSWDDLGGTGLDEILDSYYDLLEGL